MNAVSFHRDLCADTSARVRSKYYIQIQSRVRAYCSICCLQALPKQRVLRARPDVLAAACGGEAHVGPREGRAQPRHSRELPAAGERDGILRHSTGSERLGHVHLV